MCSKLLYNYHYFLSPKLYHPKLKLYILCLVTQSYLTLYDPIDCSPSGSSVHGISQARILEWVALPFSRGSSWSREKTQVFCIAGRFFTILATFHNIKCVLIMFRHSPKHHKYSRTYTAKIQFYGSRFSESWSYFQDSRSCGSWYSLHPSCNNSLRVGSLKQEVISV